DSKKIFVPEWIKNNAGWWAEGKINDESFVQGIQYLIQKEIIKIPKSSSMDDSKNKEIPQWIKNNAGWWAEGKITDSDFVSGIEYLVNQKIITY
ncbi:MAG: peptidase, partial [Nitrosarchaeum sp.]